MSDFNLTFPFQKIDKERRIVTGIATADNLDQDDEEISYEASLDAFSKWVGNIREMHQPIAVGKSVDYQSVPVMFRGNVYQGIEASVYISKGAEDTWQKILDGTLRGFSVGGKTLEYEEVWNESLQRRVKRITKYILGELSLVDNPCNPASMFTMIKRADDGKLVYDNEVEKIYYCFNDKFATIGENKFCVICSNEMKQIGESESLDSEVITKMLKTYTEGGNGTNLHKNANDDTIINTMSEEREITKEGVLSKLQTLLFDDADEVAKSETPQPTVIVNINKDVLEKSEKEEVLDETKVEEVTETVEETVIEKSNKEDEEVNLDDILEKFSGILDTKLDEKLATVKEEIQAEVSEKFDNIEKSVTEVTEKVEDNAEEITKVANSGAEKKSEIIDEEVTETEDKIEKSASTSFWGGIFVPNGVAELLGYDS